MANPNGLQYPSFCMKCVYQNSGVCSRICMTCVKKEIMATPSKFEADCKKTTDDFGQSLFDGK